MFSCVRYGIENQLIWTKRRRSPATTYAAPIWTSRASWAQRLPPIRFVCVCVPGEPSSSCCPLMQDQNPNEASSAASWVCSQEDCIGLAACPRGEAVRLQLLYQLYFGRKPKIDQAITLKWKRGPKKETIQIRGTVAHVGPIRKQPGNWIGIATTSAVGVCDGTLDNLTYFCAAPGCACFVPYDGNIEAGGEPSIAMACGQRVRLPIQNKICVGKIAYLGPIFGGTESWIGVALDTPSGYCNGTVDGV